jgi:competence protein ComEC
VRVPVAVACLPLLAGVVGGLVAFDHGAGALSINAAAAALLALVSASGACAIGDSAAATAAIALGCSLAGVSLGVSSASAAYRPPILRWFEARSNADGGAPVLLEGVLLEDAALAGPSPSLTMQVCGVAPVSSAAAGCGRARKLGGVRLTVAGAMAPARTSEWRAGRSLRVTALLRLPTTYFDPGVRDDRRALARRGIALVGTVKSAGLVAVDRRGSRVSEAAATARAWVRNRLMAAVGFWSVRSAAIATAVLIGDRTGLPDADTRRLQDAGTYHVIAISGGNIAILTALLMATLPWLGVPSRAAAVATIVLLVAYREVVVPAASVERAIGAALIYLTARVIDHRGAAMNVLGVAATFEIARAPIVVLDPGFLLSFSATLGILVAGRVGAVLIAGGRAVRSRVLRLTRTAAALFWTTVAAEVALLPVSAVLFGRVTAAGLLLNFVAIPLMSVLQAVSLLALAASSVSMASGRWFGAIAHVSAEGIVESARLTDAAPWLARDVVAPSAWLIVAYYAAAIGCACCAGPRLRRACGIALAAMVFLLMAGPGWSTGVIPAPRSGLRAVFLDVGQGDATVLILPGGRAVLVDAGGVAASVPDDTAEADTSVFDIGQRIVGPALRALGVQRLETLVVTHGDPDHIGGAPAVLRAFRPPAIWEGVPVPPHPRLRMLSRSADDLGLRWRTVQAGDVERIGPVSLCVLHPPLPEWERQRVRNEDSVVLDVRVGEVSIVLPGDIGTEGERAILPRLQPARVVVLKAPHHGSATSSTEPLLAALRPAAVIFSAGRNNRFGHPAPVVVSRYRSAGTAMFSTAEDGAVIVDTDGKDLRVWTWRSDRAELVTSEDRRAASALRRP